MAGRKLTQALENHARLQASPLSEELPPGYKMTELGLLPEEWQVVPLRLLGQISAGGSAPQGSHYFGGTHSFVRVQHLDEDGYEVRRWDLITDEAVQRYRLRLFPPGTIVFPKSGASIRLEKRAILARPSYLVSHLCAIVPNYEIVNGDFLFFALKQMPLAAEKAEGYPTLSLTEIGQRLVPLPPLSEQRAIAYVLRTVQRAKEATERVIATLWELKKSLMRHLFTYGPVPVDQADQVALKETEIGPVPEEWEVVPFGEAIAQTVQVPKVKRSAYQSIGSIPVVDQGQSLIAGYVDDIKPYEGELPVIIFGDHTRIFKFVDFPFVAGADGTQVLLPNRTYFVPRFLYYAFTATEIPSRGYNRHFGLLREKSFPKPSLSEQQAIVDVLCAVDQKIEAEEARQRALETLFRTLLHDLMTARLRLPPAFIARFAEDAP